MYDNTYFAAFVPAWLSRTWVRTLVGLLLAFLCIVFIFKACSSSSIDRLRYYTVGRDSTWYTFPIGRHASSMVAFTDELMAATAVSNAIHIKIYDTTSTSLLFGLNNGQWDGILAALEPNGYDSTQYSFSQPFYSTGLVLVVAKRSSIYKVDDLDGKVVGILPSVALDATIARQQAVFTPYSSTRRGLDDLLSNRVDALVMNGATAMQYTTTHAKDSVRVIPTAVRDATLRLVARRNHQPGLELIEYFDKTLEQLQDDDKYKEMLMKWRLSEY